MSSSLVWFDRALALVVFVSAFLLFQVQPLIGRAILPWYGGSNSVWTTAVLFFQCTLVVGYLYAHLSCKWLSSRAQSIVHLSLLLVSLAALPIIPDPRWKPTDSGDPAARVLALLLLTVGAPYLLLSTTGPLVQAWFSRANPSGAVYRLYALSNAGSLLALVTYPFLFEPLLGVRSQAWSWSIVYIAFAVACGWVAWRMRTYPKLPDAALQSETGQSMPGLAAMLRWLVPAALASSMLLATTDRLCEDITPVPLLWVAPLSAYLLSFIICFDHQRWYRRRWWAGLALAALALLPLCRPRTLEQSQQLSPHDAGNWLPDPSSFSALIIVHLVMLFAVCMVCHGELARSKPAARHLTLFYLMISLGGALGGVLVGVVAPRLLTDYFEWPLGLIASFSLASVVFVTGEPERAQPSRAWRVASGGACLAGLIWLLATLWQVGNLHEIDSRRNFYGVVHIDEVAADDPETHLRGMRHGRVLHGLQFMASNRRGESTMYYSPTSGVGRVLAASSGEPRHVGIVGLGAGTLASYGRPGDTFRFYEINPVVVDLARGYFSFLADFPGQLEVVVGDARLEMEREPPQEYDLLVIDAFSSDAIPAHLLTREAFDVYLQHLKPAGVLAAHISNDRVDLAPLLAVHARQRGWPYVHLKSSREPNSAVFAAHWFIMARDPATLAAYELIGPGQALNPPFDNVRIWTDDHTHLLELLR